MSLWAYQPSLPVANMTFEPVTAAPVTGEQMISALGNVSVLAEAGALASPTGVVGTSGLGNEVATVQNPVNVTAIVGSGIAEGDALISGSVNGYTVIFSPNHNYAMIKNADDSIWRSYTFDGASFTQRAGSGNFVSSRGHEPLAISNNGNTLIAGVASTWGTADIHTWSGADWVEGSLLPDAPGDAAYYGTYARRFGCSAAVNSDGTMCYVGAYGYEDKSTGWNNWNQGAVYKYSISGSSGTFISLWVDYVSANTYTQFARIGISMKMSADDRLLVVCADGYGLTGAKYGTIYYCSLQTFSFQKMYDGISGYQVYAVYGVEKDASRCMIKAGTKIQELKSANRTTLMNAGAGKSHEYSYSLPGEKLITIIDDYQDTLYGLTNNYLSGIASVNKCSYSDLMTSSANSILYSYQQIITTTGILAAVTGVQSSSSVGAVSVTTGNGVVADVTGVSSAVVDGTVYVPQDASTSISISTCSMLANGSIEQRAGVNISCSSTVVTTPMVDRRSGAAMAGVMANQFIGARQNNAATVMAGTESGGSTGTRQQHAVVTMASAMVLLPVYAAEFNALSAQAMTSAMTAAGSKVNHAAATTACTGTINPLASIEMRAQGSMAGVLAMTPNSQVDHPAGAAMACTSPMTATGTVSATSEAVASMHGAGGMTATANKIGQAVATTTGAMTVTATARLEVRAGAGLAGAESGQSSAERYLGGVANLGGQGGMTATADTISESTYGAVAMASASVMTAVAIAYARVLAISPEYTASAGSHDTSSTSTATDDMASAGAHDTEARAT